MNSIINKTDVKALSWAIDPGNFQKEIRANEPCYQVQIFRGSGVFRHEFNLTEAGSELELLIIYLGSSDKYLNLTTQINHLAPSTRAKVGLKAILWDQSRLDFKGNLWVPAQAHQTDTYLKCETLLMSPQAQAKAIPALEIIANDVKAGHAATAGRVDDELLFYLESRGFDRQSAQKLLIEAFLAEGKNFFSQLGENERKELIDQIWQYLPEINL
jgi:Fe-S cluster assembly scaffold protein SufB